MWCSLIALIVEAFVVLVRTAALGRRRPLFVLLRRITIAVLLIGLLVWLFVSLLVPGTIIVVILIILLVIVTILHSVRVVVVSNWGLLSISTVASPFCTDVSASYVCLLSTVYVDSRGWPLSGRLRHLRRVVRLSRHRSDGKPLPKSVLDDAREVFGPTQQTAMACQRK